MQMFGRLEARSSTTTTMIEPLQSSSRRARRMYAQQKLRSVCSSSLSTWWRFGSLATHRVPCENSGQTAITKTCLFKYTETFTTKKRNFSDKIFWLFSYFCSKHRLWVLVRTAYGLSWLWVPVDISKIYLHNFDPLQPHSYIVKLGFTGQKQSMFWAEIWKNIRIFIWKLSVFGGEIFNIFE